MGNDRALHALVPPPPPRIAALMAELGFSSFDDVYATGIPLLARLREHGVSAVTGVDSGMGPPKRHGNVWRMAGEMVQAGYPVTDALAAATSVAADACALTGQTGRLAPGQAADLLVVDGDLAQDISQLASPQAVLVRGTPVELD